jgi:hypothetical protein
MRKLIETAALGLSLCLGGWSYVPYAHAQDPEEGAVDLNQASRPTASAPERQGSAWETPPGAQDNEDVRGSSSESTEAAAPREPGPGKWRVFIGPRLGVGGGFRPNGQKYTWTAKPSPGAQLGVDYAALKYFAVGFEMRGYFTEQVQAKHKYLFLDFVLRPRVLYRFKPYPVEIYLGAAGGLSFNVPGSQKVATATGSSAKEKGKVGGVAGLMWGGSYFFSDAWALNAEFGWNWTFMRVDTWVQRRIAEGVPIQLVPTEAKITLGQATIALNAIRTF